MTKKFKNPPLVYFLMQVNITPIMLIHRYIPEFQDKIRQDFPNSKKFIIRAFNFTADSPQVNKVEQWYFADRAQTTGLIIDANSIFIHSSHYTTFNEMLDVFMKILGELNIVVKGFTYNRLGLRYVNFISDSENNLKKQFLGFNLNGNEDIAEQYISKTETIQKTHYGAIRVKSSTFDDSKHKFKIRNCMPPDLIEPASKILFEADIDKVFTKKFTVLDIDHYTVNNKAMDFSAETTKRYIELHNVIKNVFQFSLTKTAIKELK